MENISSQVMGTTWCYLNMNTNWFMIFMDKTNGLITAVLALIFDYFVETFDISG